MREKMRCASRGAIVGVLLASAVAVPLQRSQAATVDATAPVVRHDPVASEVGAGTPLTISATVTDNVGVDRVTLYYRSRGEDEYRRAEMQRIAGTDIFVATLDGEDIREPAFEYYVEAADTAGNILLVGYALSPLIVSVTESRAAAAPVAAAPETAPRESTSKAGTPTWMWVLMGVGVAALAAGAGGGGGSSDRGDVVIDGPLPTSRR